LPNTAMREILVVDDNPDDVALFKRILERGRYSVTSYNSAKPAMRAIREKAFDLMILDLSIPDMDGFEVLRAIRDQMPKMGILVVSGFLNGTLLGAARALGAKGALDKVAALDLLLESVDKLLENTR
jgi:CheY-like chemotaxis protein